MLSGRVTDKLVFVSIYTLVAVLVVIQGARHIANYVVDATFYNDFLHPWEMQLLAMRHQSIHWPLLDKGDPGAYMQALISAMQSSGFAPPKSNADQAYVYRIHKIGERPQQILIVATIERMTLYNLPTSTFERLDRFIDGYCDPASGRLTGRWSTDGITRIGEWKI